MLYNVRTFHDALEKQFRPLDLQDSAIRGLKKAYGGTQTAIISLPAEAAFKLPSSAASASLKRCFRCLEFDRLSQTIYKKGIEAAIISEPHRNNKSGAWTVDVTGKVATWACGNQAIQEMMEFPEVGFVRAKTAGIYIYSCYAPPSATIAEFEGMLVSDARSRNPKIIA